MSTTRTLIVGALAISTLAVVMWSMRHSVEDLSFERDGLVPSSQTESDAPANSRLPDAAGTAPNQDKSAPSPRIPAPTDALASAQDVLELEVFSLSSLPIHHVELRGPDTDWRAVPSTNGRVRLAREHEMPTMVRAAGHLERALLPALERVGLEPDALLEIDTPGLRKMFSAGTIGEAWGQEGVEILSECSASAFVDAEHWSIAVSSRQFRERIPAGTLRLELTHKLGARFIVDLAIQSKVRASWSLPSIPSLETQSPLHLRLDGTNPLELQGLRIVVDRIGAQEWHDRVEHDWGTTAWTHTPDHRSVEVEGAEAEIPGCALGAQYQVRCIDEQDNNLGLRRFIHDGQIQTLQLQSSVHFNMQLVESSGQPLRGFATAQVRGIPEPPPHDGKPEPLRWEEYRRKIALDANGHGRVSVPPRVLLGTGQTATVPQHTRWTFRSPFHEQVELDVDSAGATAVDMGTITLPGIPADIILYGSPGLDPAKLETTQLIAAGDASERSLIVEAARQNANGELELSLLRNRDESRLSDFLTPAPLALLVHPTVKQVSQAIPFAHVEFNRYRREPTGVHELHYRVSEHIPAGSWVTLGWSWRGLSSSVSTAQVPIDGRPQVQRFSIPEENVDLWWRITRQRPPTAADQLLSRGVLAMPRDGMIVVLD